MVLKRSFHLLGKMELELNSGLPKKSRHTSVGEMEVVSGARSFEPGLGTTEVVGPVLLCSCSRAWGDWSR